MACIEVTIDRRPPAIAAPGRSARPRVEGGVGGRDGRAEEARDWEKLVRPEQREEEKNGRSQH